MDNKTAPAVSVIIPVYNGINYLNESVDSVLAQTFTDYEVLVVDDGSTDETWDLIQAYEDRVRGIRKPNGGVASALNRGIQEARGRWIAWLSHDDVFLPDKLLKQVEFLKNNPQFKASYTGFYIIDQLGKIVGEYKPVWYPREQATRMLFYSTYMNGSSMLIERACFDKVGLFNEKLKSTQDIDMWLRMVQHYEIGRVNEPLLKWRTHPTQGSRKLEAQKAEEHATFTRIFRDLGVARIFPEFAGSADEPEVIAHAHEWFGDTMRNHHGWYSFSLAEYRQSIAAWPSWRNGARWKYMFFKFLVASRKKGLSIMNTLKPKQANQS